MTRAAASPRVAWRGRNGALVALDDLPIPADVAVGPGWTEQMREMADHIGPYPTLRIVQVLGGETVKVSADPKLSPFRDVVDAATCATLARVYCGNRLTVPVGKTALARARRALVIAAVRSKKLSGADARRILGTSRTYVAHLVNQTDEGRDTGSRARAAALPAQGDLFARG